MIIKKENKTDNSIQFIKSVGPKRAESFKKIGIETIRDLLFYFPSKHLDRSTTLTSLKAYEYVMNGYEGEITIIGKVSSKDKHRFGKKEIMKVHLRDNSGFFECIWFQGIKFFYNNFEEGEIFAVSGKPSVSKYGSLQFVHPDFDKISEEESVRFLNTGSIIPFYRIPKELKAKHIGDFSLRKIISYAVEEYADSLEETLPERIVQEHNLMGIRETVKNLHFPEDRESLISAEKRMKFEELFYIELLVALRRHNYRSVLKGNSFTIKSSLVKRFIETLPFELTKAQLRVLSEIKKDMMNPEPMNRLLQGDVGSGKTIVALISMLIAVDNGFQAALMAPTEILADQHAKNISKLMRKLEEHGEKAVKVSVLLGGQKKSIKDRNLQDIETSEADIIIGTHAIFEEKVRFNNLGLVIVDEQHRFGVEQRKKLQIKGNMPDVIVMSATPIPRTLAMTLYGDLDVSVIDELPKNRKAIKTLLRGEESLPDIFKFVLEKAKEGIQTYIVYPLVEESEKLDLKAAETHYKDLSSTYLSGVNVGLLHGRMNWQEKEDIMIRFLHKEYDVLISTTVIEVGIDIPDANIMIINDAHRFGLSQLHQLRGRVGRSTHQSYCILVTKNEYAAAMARMNLDIDYMSPGQLERYKSAVRLKSMVNHTDGFKIAEIDLKLRGPGDLFGTKQSGFPELKYADITEDEQLLRDAKQTAFMLVEEDPHFKSEINRIVRNNLIKHYADNLQYAKIA